MAAYRQTQIALPRFTPVVATIMAGSTLVFILQNTSLASTIAEYLGLSLSNLAKGRIWALVSFSALHLSFPHVLWNMIAVFFFGPRLEERMGGAKFALFYAVCSLFAGFAFCGWAALAGATDVWVVGASGSVFGIYAMWFMLWPDEQVWLMALIPIKIKWMMLGLIAFTLFALWTGGGGVAHQAHLGGAVGGLFWWWLTEYRRRRRKPGPRKDPKRRIKLRLVKGSDDKRLDDIFDDLDLDGPISK